MSSERVDLAIIGAGPAGMAAATEAAASGLSVAVIDEQPQAGGQIYRNVGEPVLQDPHILGTDYYQGAALVRALQAATITHIRNASVWEVSPTGYLCLTEAGVSRRLLFSRLLMAPGAQERPVPFPGWTTPGVMTCGSAQILLKSSGLTPAAPVVLAGSGPLLLLVACQLSRAGIPVAAVLDTTPTAHYWSALAELGGALRGWQQLLKGVRLLAELKRSGIPRLTAVNGLRAEAGEDGKIAKVCFRQGDRDQQLDCTTLLVHQGVVPNVQLSRALKLEHRWDALQQCWRPQLDAWGEGSLAGVFVAGDSAGIGGALAAEQQGRLAALQIAQQLNKLDTTLRDQRAAPIRKTIAQQLAIRPFLDRLYQPAGEFLRPSDQTLVCRCEEVTAGEIRSIARQGCAGPNQAKAFSRAGMGPCQGRQCGLTVAQLMAEVQGVSVAEVGYYNIRMPVKPITLGELADLDLPA